MRHALYEAEPLGKGGGHEYNRNAGSCRFQGYGCCWIGGDEQIGAESYQLGGESWQAILGGGITILDDQVSSINPAVVSQPVKPRFLNGRLHHIHGEKANPTTCPLRQRTPWRNEQRRTGRNELSPLHFDPHRSLRTTERRVSRLNGGRTHWGYKCCVANAARGPRPLWVLAA